MKYRNGRYLLTRHEIQSNSAKGPSLTNSQLPNRRPSDRKGFSRVCAYG
jgi:hypothetical protein